MSSNDSSTIKLGSSLAARRPTTAEILTGEPVKTLPAPPDVLLSQEYPPIKVIGQGMFGIVYSSYGERNEIVAVKKVLLDSRFKNRELLIMKSITNAYNEIIKIREKEETNNPKNSQSNINCCLLRACFQTKSYNKQKTYTNFVMDYLPMSLHQFNLSYRKSGNYPPLIYVKLFAFQLFSALHILHSISITHRDIKPQNILIDKDKGVLKLCDFGSAKSLKPNEESLCYISSRYYRSPELLFEYPFYSSSVDIWAAGCSIVELLMAGIPLFQGDSSVNQLLSILKVIGLPSNNDIMSINKKIDFELPKKEEFPQTPLRSLLPRHTPEDLYELLVDIFKFHYSERPTAFECMQHRFFDDLFTDGLKMPSGEPFPKLDRNPPIPKTE